MHIYFYNSGHLNYFRHHGFRFFQGTLVQHRTSASLQISYAYIMHSTPMEDGSHPTNIVTQNAVFFFLFAGMKYPP